MKTAAGGWRPAALCVLLLALAAAAEFTRLSSRTVTTKYGALKGYIETPVPPGAQGQQSSRQQQLQPVEVFLGVPYAAPPTGAMRFMPPRVAGPLERRPHGRPAGARLPAAAARHRLRERGRQAHAPGKARVPAPPAAAPAAAQRGLPLPQHLHARHRSVLYTLCACVCVFEPACLLCATAISPFFLAILSRLRVGGAHRRGDGLIRAPAEEESSHKRSR
ncbi:hypothetical protein MRX96_012589 [Rhipicephalus microplus]